MKKKKYKSGNEALLAVLKKLNKMPVKKLKKLIDEHQTGFWGEALEYAWTGKKPKQEKK